MTTQDWSMSGLPPELEAENKKLKRKQSIAEAMLAASQRPYQQQTAGGYVVPYSPFEGAAKLLSAYGAKRKQEEVDKGYTDIGKRYNEGLAGAVQEYSAAKNAPAVQSEPAVDEEVGLPPTPPKFNDPRAAITKAIVSQYPQLRSLAQMDMQTLNRKEDREDTQRFRADQAAEQRAQRMRELEMRLADARTNAQDRADMQRELAQMRIDAQRDAAAQSNALRRDLAAQHASQGNKPPPGFRYLPNGDMERIPGGPADIKAQAELEKKASGSGDVEVALGTLRDAYDRLQKGGGITSTANSGVGNVLPSLASSGPGQAVGRLFGTQNQSARNDIAMARPALLAALMKATGMSAKQMDSNAELKLWLSTATDPTLDVESNRRALDNIERKYLGANRPAGGGQTTSGRIGATVPDQSAIDAELRRRGINP